MALPLSEKSLKGLFMVVLVFILFFGVNHWLIERINRATQETIQEQPASKRTVASTERVRFGIPIIDPENDPLAPVNKRKVADTPPVNPSEPKKVYEFSQDSDVLLQ